MPMRCRPLQAWTVPLPSGPVYRENRRLLSTVFRGNIRAGSASVRARECPPGIAGGGERRALVVDAGGPAGEHDATVALSEDRLEGLRARDDLGVHAHLTDAAGDQLAVLCAEIQDADLVHADPEETLCVPRQPLKGLPDRRRHRAARAAVCPTPATLDQVRAPSAPSRR